MNSSSTRTRARGDWAESLARDQLESRGLQTICRNYRCKRGEIDLVMRHGRTVVFVEVRYRGRNAYVDSAESIDRRKRLKIATAARHFLLHRPTLRNNPCRFDVVAVSPEETGDPVDWIQDAFDDPYI